MKKLLYITLLLLPLITQGQSQSVTMQFRRMDPQVNSLDSIYYTFPGKLGGYSWFWNAAKIRDYVAANGSVTASEGLTKTGNNIVLGGLLTAPTGIFGNTEDGGFAISFAVPGYKYSTNTGFNTQAIGMSATQTEPTSSNYSGFSINPSRSKMSAARSDTVNVFELSNNKISDAEPDVNDTTFSARFTDRIYHRGIVYSSVDRSKFVDTSLVDKGYVDNAVSAGSVTVSNGLTKTGSDIALGGNLTGDTYIDGLSHNLLIGDLTGNTGVIVYAPGIGAEILGSGGGFNSGVQANSGSASMFNQQISPTKSNNFTMQSGAITVTDNYNHRGIVNDNSITHSLYTSKTLTDKSYVDSVALAGIISPDSVLHANKNLYDIPNKATARLNIDVYSKSEIDTKVQLKQPRIISALPTQTSGRPIVGDSVNAAIAKERFRSDSISSAIGTRVLKSGDTMTGTLTTQSIASTTNATYDIGASANAYSSIYGVRVAATNIKALSTNMNFQNVSNTAIGTYFGVTGNLLIQTGGTQTDNGQKLQVTGRARITQGLTGTVGIDSIYVHDNTSKELKLISPNAFLSNPMTTLGDVIYGGASGTPTRLAGNTATSRQFLTSTGNGTISAAPAYYNLFGTNATWTGVQTFTFGAVIGGGSPLNYDFGSFSTNFGALTATANRTINLPNASGTVALTSDVNSPINGTPTIVAGTGAGTSPTVSVTTNGKGLQVTVTTGTLPTGTNAVVATVTLANAVPYTPYPVFSSANAATSLLNGASMIYMASSGGTNVTITSGTTALVAATTYIWNISL